MQMRAVHAVLLILYLHFVAMKREAVLATARRNHRTAADNGSRGGDRTIVGRHTGRKHCVEHGRNGATATLLVHLEHGLEALNLALVLAQQRILGVLIDLGVILNVLGAIRVPQRRQRLVVVIICRTDGGDHDCLGVAAE